MYSEYKVINKQFIEKVLAENKNASRRFVELTESHIYGAIHVFGGLSQDEINDIFQTVFVKLFEDNKRRIRNWNQKSKFTTYLYRIVINIVKDYLGSSRFKQEMKNLSSLSDSNDDSSRDIEEILSQKDSDAFDLITLRMALIRLKPDELEVVQLYYFNGLKEREISEKLGKPINTISSLKNRAIKKIRKFMEEN
ncbi:MAG: RNA polymerase sigma factor [Candidatus Marinimicrobia bacterium]|nr:RNA polymerase sigma factor [Candidatus Neomarinimicrobiota bacterium]MBL7023524.1 RNA polymerase sigma factor [Candidatus Neomarinimicrobiota bacterium]MBL7109426.1 RNA polymerase sigma factor [Candidatus Neomarinimicrobiota bacterium]